MRILVHTCCAVCLAGIVPELQKKNVEITAFFHNPNVHPLIEWRRRLKATRQLCERLDIPLDVDDNYGLVNFLRAVHGKEQAPGRCRICYRMRMDETASRAGAGGFDAFSTTLLASTHQDLDLVRGAAREASAAHDVTFMDADWRHTQEAGHECARKMSLYRQQYCGCVFSEYDRYKDTAEHLYRGRAT